MSHYICFYKSQTFALFPSLTHSTSSIIHPITIIPSLFPPSLRFSPFLSHSRSNPKCALLVQRSLYRQHISHGSDVALHSILYRICHAETLQDINIYSSAPHHCCLKLHLFHTLSYSAQILISLSLYFFYVCFYFSELIFYMFSGYLSLPPIWAELPQEKRTEKNTSERLIHENQRAKSPPMKKEITLQPAGQLQIKSSIFLAAIDGIFSEIKKRAR